MDIKILDNNKIQYAELIKGHYSLEFVCRNIYIKKEGIGKSYFYLLQEIRQDLEMHNIYILCVGSRCDVYARGMKPAFILKMGIPNKPSEAVNIFDPIEERDILKIKTVQKQEEYKESWFRSFN